MKMFVTATRSLICMLGLIVPLAACQSYPEPPRDLGLTEEDGYRYRIGIQDSVSVSVWQAPEFSSGGSVRPDGFITMPLLEDVPVLDRTSMQLADEMEERLSAFIQDPIVTVTVNGFVGSPDQQVRIIREASGIQTVPYRINSTLFDTMANFGGLGPFDSGNRARLVRIVDGEKQTYGLKLKDLLEKGEMEEDAPLMPGDVIYIPEALF